MDGAAGNDFVWRRADLTFGRGQIACPLSALFLCLIQTRRRLQRLIRPCPIPSLNPSHYVPVRMETARLPCVTKTPQDSSRWLASFSTAVRLHMGIRLFPPQQTRPVHPPLPSPPCTLGSAGTHIYPSWRICCAPRACPQHTAFSASFSGQTRPSGNFGICSVIEMEPACVCSRSADGWRRHLEACGANQSVGTASVANGGSGLHSFSGLLIAHPAINQEWKEWKPHLRGLTPCRYQVSCNPCGHRWAGNGSIQFLNHALSGVTITTGGTRTVLVLIPARFENHEQPSNDQPPSAKPSQPGRSQLSFRHLDSRHCGIGPGSTPSCPKGNWPLQRGRSRHQGARGDYTNPRTQQPLQT